jgi:hypothetical protein
MDSNGLITQISFNGRLATVVYFLPGIRVPITLSVHIQDLDNALESIREYARERAEALAGLRDVAQNNQPSEETRPIPESMLVECVPLAGDTCSICLDDADLCAEGSPWVSLHRCQHRFHAHCIRQWRNSVCPYCREQYDAEV